jgi:hypothetical protein
MTRKRDEKDINSGIALPRIGKGLGLRIDHISRILSESVDLGKGGRAKNLKAYVRFFRDEAIGTKANIDGDIERTGEENGNEYLCRVGNRMFFYDLWPWGILAYHSLDEEGTDEVERFIDTQPLLRKPWIDKDGFEEITQEFVKQGGRIVIERCEFNPYGEYSGWGMSLTVRGSRTNEVIDRMKKNYVLHPRKIGLEFGDDRNSSEFTKFEMFNNGRISFSSGRPESMVFIISHFANFVITRDDQYDYQQSKRTTEDGVTYRQIFEVISLGLPSMKRIGVSREVRDEAILKMLTTGEGIYGYIGMPIGKDRASIVDLKDNKMLQISVSDDKLYVFSENPSRARSSIRRLVSAIANRIDPDVRIERIRLGE